MDLKKNVTHKSNKHNIEIHKYKFNIHDGQLKIYGRVFMIPINA